MQKGQKPNKRFFLVLTEQEETLIKEESKRRGMELEQSNIVREGMRLYFEKYGTKLPPGAFADRKRGNRLPKNDLPTAVNDRQAETLGLEITALVPAL